MHRHRQCAAPDPADTSPDRVTLFKKWLPVMAIVLAACAAYVNSFTVPFILDDQPRILNNERIRSLWPPEHIIAGSNRPLVYISFALNYAWHGLDVRGFHVTNLLIHIITSLALFAVLHRTWQREIHFLSLRSQARGMALAATLLWTIHPLQTESITYIFQRSESLMGMWYILTLWAGIRYMDNGRNRWAWLSILCCLLGMASKAVMVTAPVAVLAYDRVFVSGSLRKICRRRKWYYTGLALTWTMLAALLTQPHESTASAGFAIPWLTPGMYLRTQPQVILHYLRLTFWPHPLVLDYAWPVATHFYDVVPPAIVIVFLIAVTAWALRRCPEFGFWGLWFFLALLPSSSFIPIADMAFEHRMYLPLAGITALTVLLSARALSAMIAQAESRRRWGRTLTSLAVVLLCMRTIARNADYRQTSTIWENVLAERPENVRAQYNLGLAYLQSGDKEQARQHFLASLRLWPSHAKAHNNLGNIYSERGEWNKAGQHYRRAIALEPGYDEPLNNFGVLLMEQGNLGEAETYLRRSLQIKPDSPATLKNLGNCLFLQDRFPEARKWYEQALTVKPDYAEVAHTLGQIDYTTGAFSDAHDYFQHAVDLEPDNALYHNSLGAALLAMNQAAASRPHFQRALELDPGYGSARHNLRIAESRLLTR